MGLSFYICHNCGATSVNDCVWCNEGEGSCDNTWCSEECASIDGLIYHGTEEDGGEWSDCNYCRCEVAEDYELLNYALKKLGLSRETLQKEYLST